MRPIIRIPLAMLLTTAVISLGWIGVHASEQCFRFVHNKRHHVSAATAARWSAWDKAHPNWHPKPVKEATAAVDFACTVPLIQEPVQAELPPVTLTTFSVPMDMLPPPVPPTITAKNEKPTIFPETPALPLVSPPIYSPEYPVFFGGFPPAHTALPLPPGMAPEPSSWMLLATSLLAVGAMMTRRRVVVGATARR